MKCLILINGAGGHRPFYANVGRTLTAAGHEVEFAVDSRYTEYLYPRATLDGTVHVFSEYLEQNYDAPPLPSSSMLDQNLWRAFYPDIERFMQSRGAYRTDDGFYERVLRCLLGFFESIMRDGRFDCVVYENVSNSFVYACYLVSRVYGAKYVGFVMSRLPGRVDVVDDVNVRDSHTEIVYRQICNGEVVIDDNVRKQVDGYLADFDAQLPDYLISNPVHLTPFKRYGHMGALRTFARSLRYRIHEGKRYRFTYQIGEPAWVFPEQVLREVVRHPKLRVVRAKYYSQELPNGPFFLYPIQFHPESATSVDGVHCVDEWDNIRNVSVNMPFGVKLVVKDHKNAAAMQPLSFYERVAQLPNVQMLDCDAHPRKTLRSASAVVTVTSTMGFEAVVLGKPVFVLGRPFYDFHPLCRHISDWNGAFDLFKAYKTVVATRMEIEAFVAAYFMTSFEGPFDILAQYDDLALAQRVANQIVARVTSG